MKLIAFALILICISTLFSQTTIPAGNVSGTWDLAGSPYLIEGEIEIPDGETLTIDPGCVIEFQGHYKLNVLGCFLAIGTEQDSIRFTVADTTGFSNFEISDGGWHGIRFINTPATNDSSKIKYSILEYGKAVGETFDDRSGGALFIDNFSKLQISHNLIRKNYSQNHSSGIFIRDSNIIVLHTTFTNNIYCAIYCWDEEVIVSNCILYNNGSGITGAQEVTNSDVYENESIAIANCLNVNSCKVYNNEIGIETYFNDCTITNSLITDNEYGLWFVNDEEYLNCKIINSTFANNDLGLYIDTMVQWYGSTDVELTNSIFYNEDDCYFSENDDLYAQHCLFSEALSGANIITMDNILYTDPIFVDPVNNNYQLQQISPCVNFGTPDTTGLNIPEYDLDGNPRIFQGTFPIIDLGPYEYQGEPSELPIIIIQNDEIEFENWSPISGNSLPQEFEISNIGQTNLNITSIDAPDGFLIRLAETGDYSQSLTGFTLEPFDEAIIEIVFAPNSTGLFSDDIHIYSNAANGNDLTVHVSGESDDDLHIAADIYTDTIWDLETVIIHNDIQILQDVNLEIEPGTTVKFNYCRMDVYGNLIAEGEADNKITFTGNNTWHGMRVISPTIAPIFEHCEFINVRNTVAWKCALRITDCPDLVISNCEFINNKNVTAPASLNIAFSNIEINNCIFEGNISQGYYEVPWIFDGGEEAAIKAEDCVMIIKNTKFYNNISGWGGSGSQCIIGFESSIENLKIINTLFAENNAEILISSYYGIELTNCITGPEQGYVFFADYLSATNSILWNSDDIFLTASYQGGTADVQYSDIRGGQDAFDQNTTLNWLEGNIDSDPFFINPENGNFHFLVNSPCINAGTPDTTGLNLPEYDLDGNARIYEDIIDMGCYEWDGTLIDNEELIINNYELSNFPNPFNPSTEIEFQLKDIDKIESAKIEIYNIKGQKVKSFSINPLTEESIQSITWHGKDSSNKSVSSGIYFYRLKVDGKVQESKKMLLLK